MFAELRMKLEGNGINYKNSSNLHGFLMETVGTEYADYLHRLQMNPFSQCLIRVGTDVIWSIKTYTDEAYDKIIVTLFGAECYKREEGVIR